MRLFAGLRGLSRKNFSTELIAGVTLAALAVPLNIGYAQVAGLPPIVGLYAAIIPMAVFAVFAWSKQLVASPDAPIAALIASLLVAILPQKDPDYVQLAYAQALVCALVFLAFWFFKLGFLANFLSEPVLVGFMAGMAIEILLSQAKKILGVSVDNDHFFVELWQTIASIPEANGWNVGVGVGTIVLIVGLRRALPKVPSALVALLAATAFVYYLDLKERGVSVLGNVPSGLPTPVWPDITVAQWIGLVPGAIAICAVTLADGLLTARKYAELRGYSTNANQELFAFGAANAASGLTGGFAVGSSASRTAAMDSSGSRTQLPSLVSAGVVALVITTLTGLLAQLPNAALAAVVATAVITLIDVAQLRYLFKVRRSEFWIAAGCLLGVPVLGSLGAVVLAFLFSAIDFLRRAAAPDTARLRPGTAGRFVREASGLPIDGLVVYRFGAPLFFANATTFKEEIDGYLRRLQPGDWLVIDAEAIDDIDATGAEALESVVVRAHKAHLIFALARVRKETRELLGTYGLLDLIGPNRIYDSNESAAAAARKRT